MTHPMRTAHGNAVAEEVLQKTLEGKLPLKQIQRGFISLSVRGPHWEPDQPRHIRFGQPPHSCHQRQTFTRDKRRGGLTNVLRGHPSQRPKKPPSKKRGHDLPEGRLGPVCRIAGAMGYSQQLCANPKRCLS